VWKLEALSQPSGTSSCSRPLSFARRGPEADPAELRCRGVRVLARRRGVPAVFLVVRAAIARASRAAFRVIAFSVQRDHVHLVVEADATTALARGVQGLAGESDVVLAGGDGAHVAPRWGWRRHGLLDPLEQPGSARRQR
jgi:hypothetical protein